MLVAPDTWVWGSAGTVKVSEIMDNLRSKFLTKIQLQTFDSQILT